MCERDETGGSDSLTSVLLEFGLGQASLVVGTLHVPYQRVQIFGTKGHIDVEIPFTAPHDRACNIWVDDGFVGAPDLTVQQSSDQRAVLLTTPAANQYSAVAGVFRSRPREQAGAEIHVSRRREHARNRRHLLRRRVATLGVGLARELLFSAHACTIVSGRWDSAQVTQ